MSQNDTNQNDTNQNDTTRHDSTQVDSTAAAPAPAKKAAPRKRAAKKTAVAPPDPTVSDSTVDASAPPAKKTTRKRATKKAATPQPDQDAAQPTLIDAPADAPSVTAPGTDGAETAPVETPATTPRKRSARKVAAAFSEPAVEPLPPSPEPIEVPEPAPMTAASVSALFQPPDPAAARPARKRTSKKAVAPAPVEPEDAESVVTAPEPGQSVQSVPAPAEAGSVDQTADTRETADTAAGPDASTTTTGNDDDEADGSSPKRRRRRGGRRHRKSSGDDVENRADAASDDEADSPTDHAGQTDSESATADDSRPADPDIPAADSDADGPGDTPAESADSSSDSDDESDGRSSSRRRRRRRRKGDGAESGGEDAEPAAKTREPREPRERRPRDNDQVTSLEGSTRLQAKKMRRREGREAGRRRPPILTESEFLARREAVERRMVVRQRDDMTQIGVLEDGVLVEHYVSRESQGSMIGNIYLARVQNVLPSMEAAFVDVGRGRNAVLYAGEVDWAGLGLHGQPKRIELALKSGQQIVVQVSKDPVGHKGARLTSQVSLAGRYVVYVPGGGMSGISRKLPDTERARLKGILAGIVPDGASVVVRTAAEGASEQELTDDVTRLRNQWESITAQAESGNAPKLLYSEPDLLLKVVRDLFNSDFTALEVAGPDAKEIVRHYVDQVAPTLADRVTSFDDDHDVFATYRLDDQIHKALERKVFLPSGGSLVIDRTEAMTVIDVNTGKFTGSGGSLEETVTKNNLEAAEEIVRQLRLRDIGGIIVVDFIDMVLEANRDLVLRRLTECLGRDRTKHQVAEVTSLGLVQMTRKRIGTGLLEVFSVPCEHCNGRGVVIADDPVFTRDDDGTHQHGGGNGGGGNGRRGNGGGSRMSGPSVTVATKPHDTAGLARVAEAMQGKHKSDDDPVAVDALPVGSLPVDAASIDAAPTESGPATEVSADDQGTDVAVLDGVSPTEDAEETAPRSRRRRGRRGGRGRRGDVVADPLADGDDPEDFEPADLRPVSEDSGSTLEPVDAAVIDDEATPESPGGLDESPGESVAEPDGEAGSVDVADDDEQVGVPDGAEGDRVEPVALAVPGDLEDEFAGADDLTTRPADLSS